MAIEDDEPRDREVWSNVAQFWYKKASDESPKVGRLSHHLSILARPYTLEQFSLYARSLSCFSPFESARGSIMTLFNTMTYSKDLILQRLSLDTILIRAHAVFFTRQPSDSPDIFETASKFKATGIYAAISNIAALFEYGSTGSGASKSRFRRAFENAIVQSRPIAPEITLMEFDALLLTNRSLHLRGLNVRCNEELWSMKNTAQPMLEDYLLRGQSFLGSYYPENWFAATSVDDERCHELPSISSPRNERTLWLEIFDKETDTSCTTILEEVDSKPKPTLYDQNAILAQGHTAQGVPRRVRDPPIGSLQASWTWYNAQSLTDTLIPEASFQPTAVNANLRTAMNDNVQLIHTAPNQIPLDDLALHSQSSTKTDNKTLPSSVCDYEQQLPDLLSKAEARSERILRISWRIASGLHSIMRFTLGSLSMSFLPAVKASPISNPGTTSESSDMKPIFSLVFLLESSLYMAFAAVALFWTRSVAAKKGPVLAWGCMMYVAAYGWWIVREDGTAPPMLLAV